MSAPLGEAFDYVVVGGGTAGCVVAARLSEDAAARVLLLERGADVRDDPSVAPRGFTSVLSEVPLDFLPVEAIASREPKLTAGLARTYVPRALGGGPAVSGSFWGRGDPANYDEWARLGAEGWAYDDVLPYFKRSESFRDVLHPERTVSTDRGLDGPIEVAPHDDEDPSVQDLLEAACATFGVRRIADHSTRAGQEGFAPMQRTLGHDVDRPVRSTSYTRYVEPALAARPNLRVVSMATATRLRIEGGRATGVDYLFRGQARHAAAAREIVLCAGTIHTARLLLLSGIGPAADLKRAGIEPVVDLPGVGQNLQDHAVLKWAFQARTGTLRGGAPSSVLIGFLRSPESRDIDMEIAWGVLPGDIVTGFLVNVRNERRGVVQLISPDPLAPPVVRFDWDPRAPEMAAMAEMFRRVRRWLSESGRCAAEIMPGEALAPADGDAARWHAWFAAQMGGWYHMAGTARMGRDREAVVDAALRVRGVANLRVADCSVMPRVVSSHPSATATMIGEKAADLVRGIPRAR